MPRDSYQSQLADFEQLAEARFGPLSTAEVKLLHAALDGRIAYCGPSDRDDDPNNEPTNSDTWGCERRIRAELIRWLCIDREASTRIDPIGIRAHAASVTGDLDLSGVVVPFSISFVRCRLSDPLGLEFTEIRAIDFSGTCLPSLNANHARVKGNICLQALNCGGAVQMRGAWIGGNLECGGGKFRNPLESVSFGNLFALSVAGGGVALDASYAKVAGHLCLDRTFEAEGQVRLQGSEIGGNLNCDHGTFRNPAATGISSSGIALDASYAKVVGDIFLRNGFVAEGHVSLHGSQIGGNLACFGGRFENPGTGTDTSGAALELGYIRVIGDVYLCEQFAAEGMVVLYGSEIGGNLGCYKGTFHSVAATLPRIALFADYIKVRGGVYLVDGFVAEGDVRFCGAQIGGEFSCQPDKVEKLDIRRAQLSAIVDKAESWPKAGNLLVDGCIYGSISGSARDRLVWLERQGSFTRQPYRQLAKVLRDSGDDQGSRRVCAEMERKAWERRGWILRPVSYLLRATIGYGYFSMRALWWLLGLVAVGALVYSLGYRAGSIVPTEKNAYESFVSHKQLPGHYDGFHSLPYSLENSFPLVKLGIQDKWAPAANNQFSNQLLTHQELRPISSARFLRWFRWSQICAGWLLATLFVGGVSGLTRRE